MGKKSKSSSSSKANTPKELEELTEKTGFSLDGTTVTGVLNSKATDIDVKIGSFSLIFYGKELFTDTTIEFTIGRRYGLIGANGSGKSTFFKVLANREVPIPENIDIFYLEQEYPPSEISPLDAVLGTIRTEIEKIEKLEAKLIDEEGPDSESLQVLYQRLEELEAADAEPRAAKLLHGLGFDKNTMHKKTKDLSGGWRMRVSLAQALFIKPSLLLLDEPTNHLDLEACVWLEEYLSTYPYCLLLISHSQDFLNGVCTHIMHLTERKTLEIFTGNYDTFVKTKMELDINQQKQYEKEQADIKHLKQFISSCGTFSNLVRQAKSKQKIIDKMEAAGLTEKVQNSGKWSFKFNACDKLPPPVLSFTNVSFSYTGEMDEHLLYENIDFGVDSDSRIALVGPNGAGKTTMLKLMVGEVQPVEGTIGRHIKLRIERYHQHSSDVLPLDLNPLEFMLKEFPEEGSDPEKWRSVIGRFGITGQQQLTPMRVLSDGLKTRMVFAWIATRSPNMILLDEPTNHLDMDCIDSLADAINEYDGGIVLVSHDFRLIEQVADQIWVCENKKVTRWNKTIRDYKLAMKNKLNKEGATMKS